MQNVDNIVTFTPSRKPSTGGNRGRKPSELTNTIRNFQPGDSVVVRFEGDHTDIEAYDRWKNNISSQANRRMTNADGESVPAYGFHVSVIQDFDNRQVQIHRLTEQEELDRAEKRAQRVMESA